MLLDLDPSTQIDPSTYFTLIILLSKKSLSLSLSFDRFHVLDPTRGISQAQGVSMEAQIRNSTQPPLTAEEESLKRNTDCVYFLASPLTCKKGSECEYRHSEYARVNPRDCYFWLNGNCLNPKCSFRHPPLDGLLETPGTASEGSSLPSLPSVKLTQVPASHTSSRQAAPCIFFQKGLCLKGDRCSFMHGPQSINNPVRQPPASKAATSFTEPQTLNKAFGSLEKCTQQQKKISQANTIKPSEVQPSRKLTTKAETGPLKNGVEVKKNIHPLSVSDDEFSKHKPTNVPLIISENSLSRPLCSRQAQVVDDHCFQNGKEPDEFLGESSPGFDVLIDDELRHSDYYHDKDEFGTMTGHEVRHLNSVKESDDYRSLAKLDREPYNDTLRYDPYRREQDQYGWEQHRASSDRISERPSVLESRGLQRPESSDQIDEWDLRHRLSKQRKVDGSRSDRRADFFQRDDRNRHSEEQRYRGHSRRESRHLSSHESSISNRLQGRITLPGRLSPDRNHNDFRSDIEMDRGRNRSRLSPGRPLITSHQGSYQDRLKSRVQEDFTQEGKNFRGLPIRRYEVDNNTSDFSGPKSLAELKGSKVSESSDEQRLKSQLVFPSGEQKSSRIGKLVGQESEGFPSFEGPKPLSAILKRKRAAGGAAFENGTDSGNGEESYRKEREKNLPGISRTKEVTDAQAYLPSESQIEASNNAISSREEPRSTTANLVRPIDGDDLISIVGEEVPPEKQPAYAQKDFDLETDGTMIDDTMEDQELEAFDQRDGESDYEQVEGVEFKTEEDETADPDEEYLDDDDDFAKRIGVMFS